ncbi:MAG: hypothetical protein LBQ14_09450 [Treponema sp.]|nr:hypothetical protein [Treponema sp.]
MEKQRIVAGCLVAAVLSALAACAGGPKPTQQTELLDYKGAALGISIPAWVTTYQENEGNLAVEALPEYKDFNCFVVNRESTDKAFLLAWVNNLSGPVAIASTIATGLSQDVEGRARNIEDAEREQMIRTNTEVMINASYTGARKVADWWYLARNKETKAESYHAFALYIIEKKVLNDHIVRNLQNIADDNAAMSEARRAIYADLINEIRVNGFSNR